MSRLTDHQLYAEGMTTDQIAGFRAIVANPRVSVTNAIGLAPEHFRGARLDAFERGASIGLMWLTQRRAVANARRSVRAREIREIGACTPLDCMTDEGEALKHLRIAMGKKT